jgi:sulfatase modifying factor 1
MTSSRGRKVAKAIGRVFQTPAGSIAVVLAAAVAPFPTIPGALRGSLGEREGDDIIDAVVPKRDWRLIDGRHWQIVSYDMEDRVVTDEREGTRGACTPGMVEVRGSMKLEPAYGYLDEVEKQACARWIDREFPERCAEFDRQQWLALSADLPEVAMAFCIDRYEYPNQKGQFPWIMVSWTEASELCRADGKRLCAEEEWTFACEGEEAMPYPYGYTRSSEACVIDHPWLGHDEHAFVERAGRAAMLELDRTWQGESSGARPGCRSPFGVYDMTGNVDEWVRGNVGGQGSVLKGGYWGSVRTRCRPATRAHDKQFFFYQQGFRCCSDMP